MTRAFEVLLPDLTGARGLIGVPPEIAAFHLLKAAIELCERSHIWVQEVKIDAQAGVEDYPLELTDSAVVVAVKEVRSGQCCLNSARTGLCGGCACNTFKLYGNKTLWLPAPIEDEEQGFTALVVAKPAQDSCVLVDELYEDWAETIADGAAARCFVMPKTDWYNAGMATYYTKKFGVGLVRAKNKRVMQRTTGPLMMRGARF
jgi:hypothetical protein